MAQQASPADPREQPLEWVPPAGSPPVFVGGKEASAKPWRNAFFDRNSVPASEAGPAPSRYGAPR
eukprot:7171936-Alexandrium_andersonii.AAC.1